MSGKIEINGVDLHATHGLGTRNAGAWWDGLSAEIGSLALNDSYQGLAGAGFGVKAVSWPLVLFLRAPLRANREVKLDALRRLLQDAPDYVDDHRFDSGGEVGIKVEGSTRRLYAVYRGDRATPPSGLEWGTGHAEVTLDLLVVDPAKYDDPQTQALTASAVQISLGTLPSRYEVEIFGPATDPAFIVYADNGGVQGSEVQRITLDYEIGSGESLIIDTLLHRILYDDGATQTDVTGTAFPVDTSERFFDLDSEENSSLWVALSVGTGSLGWRKRWR
jgi:hypothetical protein